MNFSKPSRKLFTFSKITGGVSVWQHHEHIIYRSCRNDTPPPRFNPNTTHSTNTSKPILLHPASGTVPWLALQLGKLTAKKQKTQKKPLTVVNYTSPPHHPTPSFHPLTFCNTAPITTSSPRNKLISSSCTPPITAPQQTRHYINFNWVFKLIQNWELQIFDTTDSLHILNKYT